MSRPWLSIITATFNRAAMLQEAIASVRAQEESGIEHIIVDGASTDGTVEQLACDPHLRVVSERDRGIYDAFNKGVRLATGEFVHFLNSDDLLAPGALRSARELLREKAADVLTGGVEFFRRDDAGCEEVLRRETAPAALELSFHGILGGMPAINARIFRREFLGRIGEFDLTYSIASDRELLLRAALARPACAFTPAVWYRYRAHSGSLTVHEAQPNAERIRFEHLRLAEHYLAASVSAGERRALAAFHARESANLAIDLLARGDYAAARACAGRGCRANRAWPLFAARRFGGWVLGRRRDSLAG